MKKITVLAMLTTLFYSCSNDLEETLSEENKINEELTSKTLNVERLIPISSFRGPFGWVRSGDFNGDGREDLIELNQKKANILLSGGIPIFQQSVTDGRYGGFAYTYAGDFNGDGFADIASASAGTVYMKLNKALGNFDSQLERFDSANWNVRNAWGAGSNTVVGDYNGDGKDDIASASGSSVFMKISTGNSFLSKTWNTNGQWGARGYTFSGDYNGDGKDDIISLGGPTIFIKESTGSGFVSKAHTTIHSWGGSPYTWMADTNGNGKDEIITAIYGTILKREWISGNTWSFVSLTTAQYWGSPGYNFAMDFTGNGSDEIVSHLVTPNGLSLYIH